MCVYIYIYTYIYIYIYVYICICVLNGSHTVKSTTLYALCASGVAIPAAVAAEGTVLEGVAPKQGAGQGVGGSSREIVRR